MNSKNLGRLKRIDLREVWMSEASGFTPWLAQEENLNLLGEAIGIELELTAQEKEVGPFRADILCTDTATEAKVLIENQLERTDHTHLGQLLTYAAGLDTVTVIWVAQRFTDEHRAALDWLNERTDEKINFFGLEIELWQIGDSSPAPKFNVVCQPNEWTRYVTHAAKSIEVSELSERRQLQHQYWTEFLDMLRTRTKVTHARNPQPSHGMGFPTGRAGYRLWTEISIRDCWICVSLITKGNEGRRFFQECQNDAAALGIALGGEVDFDETDGRDQRYITVIRDSDPSNREDWPAQHGWMAETLERFQRVFGERLKQFT